MILSKKQAKKLKMSPVIDLRAQYSKEYLESKKTPLQKNKELFLKIIAICWIVWYLIFTILNWWWFVTIWKAEAKSNLSVAEAIRLDRVSSCAKYAHIQKIYWQDAVVRCATYMTLVYAFESKYWSSKMCRNLKNCYWMKWNWITYLAGFIKFKTYKAGDDYFAKMYFKWHYKKKINTFVNNWSMTDRKAYKKFMKDKYWEVYNEILKLKK